MKQLPKNCYCSDFSVYPNNSSKSGASIKKIGTFNITSMILLSKRILNTGMVNFVLLRVGLIVKNHLQQEEDLYPLLLKLN